MPTTGSEEADDIADPTALRHVGPVTAAVIERSPFDAADIKAGRVSHRQLTKAGINPGIAEQLRREYGLLWAFRWHPGEVDLARRAAALRDVGPAERQWIVNSGLPWAERTTEPPAELIEIETTRDSEPEWVAWPEVSDNPMATSTLAPTGDQVDTTRCPRCEGELTQYSFDDRTSVLCDSCGYAGVPVTHAADVWRLAVDRIIRGEATPQRD